ncbi:MULTISPECIES: hypothetical protein [unclassified Massilia]|uniref:hypothetical protein n=1 Tax=unclassified Massilia TaxID=2609279 RepID=UPI001784816E|nr:MULTISPECIES: hypothetical protein [unclassified Massilia]MBD8529482.1 hypothetical protein [Massilia sp. CFBP 13647]MBD8672875.1 hypothetical protein [Massilia sp. CFBP 13721]
MLHLRIERGIFIRFVPSGNIWAGQELAAGDPENFSTIFAARCPQGGRINGT